MYYNTQNPCDLFNFNEYQKNQNTPLLSAAKHL